MKTTFQRAICLMCGDKAVIMPVDYFTKGKGNANSATPAEVRLDGARIMFCEEPDAKITFLASIVKSETGGDPREARELYGEAYDFIPQHKVVIIGNKAPPMSHEDAMIDRVKILDFLSKMRMVHPETLEEQIKQRTFPRDFLFGEKLAKFRTVMLWDAFQMYPAYAKEGLRTPPASVTARTERYWASLDKYNIFKEEKLVYSQDGKTTVDEIVKRFYTWHYSYYGRNVECPDREDTMAGLTKVLKDPIDGYWYNVLIKGQPQGDSSSTQTRYGF